MPEPNHLANDAQRVQLVRHNRQGVVSGFIVADDVHPAINPLLQPLGIEFIPQTKHDWAAWLRLIIGWQEDV